MPARSPIARSVVPSKPRSRNSSRAASRIRARLRRPRTSRPSSDLMAFARLWLAARDLRSRSGDGARTQLGRRREQELRALEAHLHAIRVAERVEAVLHALVPGPEHGHDPPARRAGFHATHDAERRARTALPEVVEARVVPDRAQVGH